MKLQWKTCMKIGVSVFVLYLLIHYWSLLAGVLSGVLRAAAPLFLGAVIAYILNILMSAYERKFFPNSQKEAVIKLHRPICLVGAFLTLIAIVVLIVSLVVPQLVSCFRLIFAELPGFIERTLIMVEEWGILPEDIMTALESIDWRSRIGQIVELVSTSLGSVVDVLYAAISSVFSVLVTSLVGLIFAVYVLVSKENLRRQWLKLTGRYLPEIWHKRLNYVLATVNDCFHRYIVGQCLEAVILGVLCAVGMWILRLPYAAMVGALIAFTALIPVAGAYIGAGVGAFMILTVSPVKALVFLVFILILQQLENNLIYPKVVGSSIGLPGIWVLAAVTVGGGILGVGGMLLGVPIAAALYRMLRDDVYKYDVPAETTEETTSE